MAKNIPIIRIQSMTIMGLHLVISKTKFLPLVDRLTLRQQEIIMLNYLISTQMHGQRKLHIHSAHLSEFTIGLRLHRLQVGCKPSKI